MDLILSKLEAAKQYIKEAKEKLAEAVHEQLSRPEPKPVITVPASPVDPAVAEIIQDAQDNPRPGSTTILTQTASSSTEIKDLLGPFNLVGEAQVTNEQTIQQNFDDTVTLENETVVSQSTGLQFHFGLGSINVEGVGAASQTNSVTGSPEQLAASLESGNLPSIENLADLEDGMSVRHEETVSFGPDLSMQDNVPVVDVALEAPSSLETGNFQQATREDDQIVIETGTMTSETQQASGTVGLTIGNQNSLVSANPQFQDLVEIETTVYESYATRYPVSEMGLAQADYQVNTGKPSLPAHGQISSIESTTTQLTVNGLEYANPVNIHLGDGSVNSKPGITEIDNVETTTQTNTLFGISINGNTSDNQPFSSQEPTDDMLEVVVGAENSLTIEEAPYKGVPGFSSNSTVTTSPMEEPIKTTQASTTDGAAINASDEEIREAAQQIKAEGGSLANNDIIKDVASGEYSLTQSINNDAESLRLTNSHDNQPAVDAIKGLEQQLEANAIANGTTGNSVGTESDPNGDGSTKTGSKASGSGGDCTDGTGSTKSGGSSESKSGGSCSPGSTNGSNDPGGSGGDCTNDSGSSESKDSGGSDSGGSCSVGSGSGASGR